MRRFRYMMKLLRTSGVLCVGLILAVDVSMAQPPGGGGPGGGRGGFNRGGFGDPSLSRELRNETFSQKMNITEEQKQRLTELDMERTEFFRSLPRGGGGPGSEEFQKRMEDMQAKMKEFEAKAVEVLTPEQKTIWEERKTELKAEQGDGGRGGRGGRPDGGRPRGDVPTGTEPSLPPRRTTFSAEKAPEGTAPTASFGGGSATTDGATGGSGAPKTESGEPKLSFNFRYAPWSDVLKLFSEAAGLTLDLNDVPPGTFNYFDDKTYTVTEAMDVLNGYLLPKGFVLIRRNRFLVSLNIDNGIPPSMLPTITVDELPKRGANELLIVDVPLEGFEADKIAGEVKELTGPWGKVAAMKNTNSLNIMDTGSNISRIIRLLKAGSPQGETAFRSIQLKFISAAEAERTVRRLFGLNPVISAAAQPQFGFPGFGGGGFPQFGGGGFQGFRGGDGRGGDGRGGDGRGNDIQRQPMPTATPSSTPSPYLGKIQVTADNRTNHLLVTASSALVKVVEDAVKAIDVDTGKPITESGPAYLKAYVVAGGDATQVSRTLNSIMPGLVVSDDARSGKIHVQATREEHAEIEKLILTLSGEASGSVAVINLTRLDPIQATNTLRNLFINETRAPMIEADALGRRLLVRGSADQLAQVKAILQQLGESGPNPEGAKTDKGLVRKLPLAGHDPEQMLPLMQKIWEGGHRSPIRVVVPSQPNPVRDRRVPGARNLESDFPAEKNTRGGRPAEEARPTGRKTVQPERTGPSAQTPRRTSILQVSQSGERREAETTPSILATSDSRVIEDDTPAVESAKPQSEQRNDREPKQTPPKSVPVDEAKTDGAPSDEVAKPPAAKATSDDAPISVSIIGGEVVIVGTDSAELDQFEEMFNTLSSSMPVRTRWTIFYLRTADATDTAQMLERLFPQSSVTASTSSSNSGMFGSLTGGLSTFGRGLMNSTGLNNTLGGSNDLRIITDIRANALFVSGPQDQIAEVESMLELLDASELPSSLRDRIPRTIPIEHADVDEVAEIVESVFKDSLTPENAQGQQGNNAQRFNPLAMLMGGGGGTGRKEPGVQLTVGVDRRTNHLIVACNDNLFRQIEGLVESIDVRARDARQTVRIMHLETADPTLVSATLTSLIPKVTISASRSSRKKPGDQQPGQPGQPPDAVRDPAMIQRAMEQRNAQQGLPGGQPNTGGRQNGGGAGRGRQGGGAGGGARPNGGGGGGARPGGGGARD